MKPKKRVNLTAKYQAEIRSWNWAMIEAEAACNLYLGDGDTIIGSCYLGSILGIMPSGKYYMAWTTNQTWRDIVMDSLYWDILEEIAEEHGLYIGGGEGDGLSLYASRGIADVWESMLTTDYEDDATPFSACAWGEDTPTEYANKADWQAKHGEDAWLFFGRDWHDELTLLHAPHTEH